MINRTRGIFAKILMGVLVVSSLSIPAIKSVKATDEQVVDIVFSTDIHSYLEPFVEERDGQNVELGGMARASTYIKEMREQHPEMLLIDAGDYPMGTLYQTLFSEHAFEYRMLSKLGYDGITFGNHDFDYGSEGLAKQFDAAKANCDYYPYFVICNVNWNSDNEGSKMVYESIKDLNLKEYVILEKNGVRIGMTGVLGYDALECAPTCELEVLDPIESVKATVAKMKAEENPDIIVLLSHSGVSLTAETSEDEVLAAAVPDIDFILSGHAHITLEDYIQVGDTYIGSTGCYGENLGYAQLKKNSSGRWDLTEYKLTKMDTSVEEDEEINDLLAEYKQKIADDYLDQFGYTADMVVAENEYPFDSVDDLYFVHEDHNLGNLIADAYRYEINSMDVDDNTFVSIGVAPSGTIRATYPIGDINIAKVYESFSLGSGLDGTVGYPLVSIYLYGSELKTLCEVDATVSELMHSANLYLSGVEFEFNPHRMFLNKVIEARLKPVDGVAEYENIEDDKLYRAVTDLYSFRMLGAVESTSMGLLKLQPKMKDGTVITEESQCVITDKDGNEVKAWIAIADYIASFDTDKDGDGIGEVPSLYDGTDDRKVVNDSRAITELVKSPNKYFFGIIGAILVVIIVLVLIIMLIVKIIKFIVKAVKKRKAAK